MSTSKVTFVRHGESEWNKLNLFCGWQDVNLSAKGEWDAVAVSSAALLKENCKFDVAFCSALKRSNRTLNIILNCLHCADIPIYSSWRLNERHYGALTGFNKREMAEVHGEEQVQIWRRSFDIMPPAILPLHPYYKSIRLNSKFEDISEEEFPEAETLKSTIERVIPFWKNNIVPEIKSGKRVLVVAHGTSLRAIVKYVEGISDEDVMKLNIPNSIPFIYEFDTNTMQPIGRRKFLADDETVAYETKKVAEIGK